MEGRYSLYFMTGMTKFHARSLKLAMASHSTHADDDDVLLQAVRDNCLSYSLLHSLANASSSSLSLHSSRSLGGGLGSKFASPTPLSTCRVCVCEAWGKKLNAKWELLSCILRFFSPSLESSLLFQKDYLCFRCL